MKGRVTKGARRQDVTTNGGKTGLGGIRLEKSVNKILALTPKNKKTSIQDNAGPRPENDQNTAGGIEPKRKKKKKRQSAPRATLIERDVGLKPEPDSTREKRRRSKRGPRKSLRKLPVPLRAKKKLRIFEGGGGMDMNEEP